MELISLQQLKKELNHYSREQLAELCLKLARYKKENKELLIYLLFHSGDEMNYIEEVKNIIQEHFENLHPHQVYLQKKGLRKILRIIQKHIKFSGSTRVEVELLLHFCRLFARQEIRLDQSIALQNIWHNQIKKIQKAIEKLHEDLQYDYRKELENLSIER